MNLELRDPQLRELMDSPTCDARRLRRTLRRFSVINQAVSKWGTVYRSLLRGTLAKLDRPARVLDIGCGGGDVLRHLMHLAKRDGFLVSGLGIDPNSVAIEVANEAAHVSGLEFREATSGEIVREGRHFDIVISNHLLHHLDRFELDSLISTSTQLANHLSVHSDIARSRGAYSAFATLAGPLAPGTFIYTDGLRSIRRSYTRNELEAALTNEWRVAQVGAFRLIAVHSNSRSLI